MIDVDPKFGRTNCWKCASQPILNRGVERDRNVDIFGLARRFAHQVRARDKRICPQPSVLVPDAHIFAEFLERKRQREGAAERVAIGADMTHHRELLVLAQGEADFGEFGGGHVTSNVQRLTLNVQSRTRQSPSLAPRARRAVALRRLVRLSQRQRIKRHARRNSFCRREKVRMRASYHLFWPSLSGDSISCMISITREPRSMERSR